MKTYQREWVAARRKAFFGPKECEECGDTEQLDLHHTDPSQKTEHNIWSWSKERQEAEIAKCEVLCHTCHRGRHGSPPEHGSLSMYANPWRCRCVRCRQVKSDYNRLNHRSKQGK